MGCIRHNAIIVIGLREHVEKAQAKADKLCKKQWPDSPSLVSPVVPCICNGTASFLIAPDGSKEGWSDSAKGDDFRLAVTRWIERNSGKLFLDWIDIAGGDESYAIEEQG